MINNNVFTNKENSKIVGGSKKTNINNYFNNNSSPRQEKSKIISKSPRESSPKVPNNLNQAYLHYFDKKQDKQDKFDIFGTPGKEHGELKSKQIFVHNSNSNSNQSPFGRNQNPIPASYKKGYENKKKNEIINLSKSPKYKDKDYYQSEMQININYHINQFIKGVNKKIPPSQKDYKKISNNLSNENPNQNSDMENKEKDNYPRPISIKKIRDSNREGENTNRSSGENKDNNNESIDKTKNKNKNKDKNKDNMDIKITNNKDSIFIQTELQKDKINFRKE